MRRRVLAYVTRERDGRRELLVFDQEADPGAGTQVPAGRLDPGHPTLGDVDSAQALEDYQAKKRAYKAKLRAQQ